MRLLLLVLVAAVLLPRSGPFLMAAQPSPAADQEPPVVEGASDIRWSASMDAARTEAARSRRLIFAYVYDERVFDGPLGKLIFSNVKNDLKRGPFGDPRVVEFVNRKFVPVVAPLDAPLAGTLGVKFDGALDCPYTIVFIDPEGKLVLRFDRGMVSEELVFSIFREALRRRPECARPSAETAGLAKRAEAGDSAAKVRLGHGQLLDGDWEKAEQTFRFVVETGAASDPALESYAGLAAVYRHLRQPNQCRETIAKAREVAQGRREGELLLEEGLLLMQEEKYSQAAETLDKALGKHPATGRHDELLYYLGAVCRATGDKARAKEVWDRLLKEHPKSGWARKTESKGAILQWLPEHMLSADPRSSERPRKPEDFGAVIREACEYLLRNQLVDGSWSKPRIDSYDHTAAITALCCLALHEWRDVLPELNRAACERGLAFLDGWMQKSPNASGTKVWAHAYTLRLSARLAKLADGDEKKTHLARAGKSVQALKGAQLKDGGWHYQKSPICASFLTADVLLSLGEAKDAGLDVPDDMVKSALTAVAGLRTDADVFKYTERSTAEIGMSKIESNAPGGAAGRTPICRLAQYAWAKCDVETVERAVSSFMEHRSELERVRKVTDSHYGRYGNAPYDFYYDYSYAAEAMTLLPNPKRQELLTRVRDELLQIHEADGSWLDCHPIGKNAGTAQALLTLRHCDRILAQAR